MNNNLLHNSLLSVGVTLGLVAFAWLFVGRVVEPQKPVFDEPIEIPMPAELPVTRVPIGTTGMWWGMCLPPATKVGDK